MRFTRILAVTITVTTIATFALVSGARASEGAEGAIPKAGKYANVDSGDWKLGGSFSFTQHNHVAGHWSETRLATEAERFVADRFAVGLGYSLTSISDLETVSSLGPQATYFFWDDGRVGTSLSLGYQFGLSDATVKSYLTSQLGISIFLTPSVAFGPALFYNHYNSRRGNGYSLYGMLAEFGIYL